MENREREKELENEKKHTHTHSKEKEEIKTGESMSESRKNLCSREPASKRMEQKNVRPRKICVQYEKP